MIRPAPGVLGTAGRKKAGRGKVAATKPARAATKAAGGATHSVRAEPVEARTVALVDTLERVEVPVTPDVVEVIPAAQGDHAYPVRVGPGAIDVLPELLDGVDRVVLVSCKPVLATPFGQAFAGRLEGQAGFAGTIVLPDGEAGKTLAQLEKAAVQLLQSGATRRSLVVGLGGGAVTDAAGFLAATFMRGIRWVAVPTTVLAMVDAAIGGKTAVNLPVAKNAVGAFHPPIAVLADPDALATLPQRERASGKGEVIKYGALQPGLLDTFASACARPTISAAILATCARMKVDVVADDPTEQGPRKLLNLGHTYGHGVEAAGGFSRYTHGEAVAVGLAYAFRLARRLGRVDDAAVERVEAALVKAGLPVAVPEKLARAALGHMAFDKKRTAAGLRWVLPRSEGRGWRVEWDVEADAAAVEATAAEVVSKERRPAGRGRRS
ncbi:MAG: 3-dehydroquinate synthase family protein [Anaeromyxobacter sp.]